MSVEVHENTWPWLLEWQLNIQMTSTVESKHFKTVKTNILVSIYLDSRLDDSIIL